MTTLPYLLTGTLLLGAILTAYWLVLQHDKLLRFNRYYLLATLVLPWVVPFLPSPLPGSAVSNTLVTVTLPQFTVGSSATPIAGTGGFGPITIIWLTGAAISLLVFGWRWIKLIRMMRQPNVQFIDDIRLIPTDGAIFSFGHTIFAPQGLLDDPNHPVMRHEIAHVRQQHTADVLLGELATIIFWFHPLVHATKMAIRANHEYLADAAALDTQGITRRTYSELMIQHATQPVALSLGNHFSTSKIKKRMIMVHTSLSMTKALLKRALLLPVLAGLTLWACDSESSVNPTTHEEVAQDLIEEPTAPSAPTVEYDEVFQVVEEMPQFEGGQEGMINYLSNELTYPASMEEKGIAAQVFVSFVISEDGKVTNVEVMKNDSGEEAFSAEALRVVAAMPNWTPGKQEGKPVPVKYVLPIKFQLS